MATYAFANGVATVPAYGQRDKFRFVGTWANNDTWSIAITTSTNGDYTFGKGNIAGQTFTNGLVFRDRVYVSFSSTFAFSALEDPTKWEEQDPGAGTIAFNSNYGNQDTVKALATIQGRLAVFGSKSIQLWSIDADPANFALQQVLDNSGTVAAMSVQSIGDDDILYLDSSGVRSLKVKEYSQNSTVSDVGSPIDSLVTEFLRPGGYTEPVSIVDPVTKQYWIFLDPYIYVLSNFPASKILAWTRFRPVFADDYDPGTSVYNGSGEYTWAIGFAGVSGYYYWTKGANATSLVVGSTTLTSSGFFTVSGATTAVEHGTIAAAVASGIRQYNIPMSTNNSVPKFVIKNNRVYVRVQGLNNDLILLYGGASNTSYDYCQPTVELPWNDLGNPTVKKQAHGIEATISGEWTISVAMDPKANTFTSVYSSTTGTPNVLTDSTYDTGHIPYSGNGTHFKLKAVGASALNKNAKLGKLSFVYKKSNVK